MFAVGVGRGEVGGNECAVPLCVGFGCGSLLGCSGGVLGGQEGVRVGKRDVRFVRGLKADRKGHAWRKQTSK